MFQDKFDKSLKQLDLQGIILLQGLLSQRAIELLMQDQKKPESKLLIPESKVVL